MSHSLVVKFYRRPWQNFFKSTAEGRPIFEDKDFVKICIPGNQLTEIDTLAEPYHEAQYPVEWARYQNALNADDAKLEGTPLSAWSGVLPSVAENLKYYKFFTVEQIANASDAQLKAIDFVCGANAFHLREQAKYYLASTKETADKAMVLAKNEEILAQNQDLKDQVAMLMETVLTMQKDMTNLKKRGAKKIAEAKVIEESIAPIVVNTPVDSCDADLPLEGT